MRPDATFYAVLIEVVGAAGDLKTAHDIFADAKTHPNQKQVLHAAYCIDQSFLHKLEDNGISYNKLCQ